MEGLGCPETILPALAALSSFPELIPAYRAWLEVIPLASCQVGSIRRCGPGSSDGRLPRNHTSLLIHRLWEQAMLCLEDSVLALLWLQEPAEDKAPGVLELELLAELFWGVRFCLLMPRKELCVWSTTGARSSLTNGVLTQTCCLC